MGLVLLIRHASHDLLGKRLAGRQLEVHLNRAGEAEAERLAERLQPLQLAAVYTSPRERALETAVPLARRHGLHVEISAALDEFDLGEWSGRTFAELQALQEWQRFNRWRSGTRPPGGELMLEVQARIVQELERLQRRHPGAMLALVSHADVIRAALTYYLGMPLDLFGRLQVDPASVSVLALHEWGPEILRLNDTGEAPGLVSP